MGKLHNFKQFLASRRGQIVFNLIYSWGAAVVIFGAMCKIMHFGGVWDYVLMVGLIVEAIVFIAAGFDYSSTTAVNTENAGVAGGGILIGGSSAGVISDTPADPKNVAATTDTVKGKVGSSGSVVVISGGGGSGSGGGTVSSGSGGSADMPSGSTTGVSSGGGTVVVGGGQSGVASGTTFAGGGGQSGMVSGTSSGVTSGGSSGVAFAGSGSPAVAGGSVTPEYAQSLSNTAQNLEDFSQTIHSLNEASQKMLDAYKNVTETQGFVDNLATLNQNVSGLNEVFNTQMQTITEQMSAVRYINDSLQRIKNLYDGAIGDSYMFREESAKMTKHIEALNNVYARLLQAMTTNNNNNMNQNNF